ncbi:hypothetical protein H2O64_15245 [Kordia sp. YSTF-M3]|uniref:DUF3185 family protein n=1 Tax=Kordia aestuariivivens TaxID=2759037 RepID=A0ABR7QBS6_9FLAO|nr:hypothetical protein [Kordia aestuariivivens]MBC8756032.1 hypothetical protein [Kordia aestuariivivens]
METFRGFIVLIGIISVIISFYFGKMEVISQSEIKYNVTTTTSHSGMNGGAIGFGLISGMSFIAIAITFIGREENDYTKHR